MSKQAGHKVSTPLSWKCSKLGPISLFSPPVSCELVSVTRSQVWMGSKGVLNLVLSLSLSHSGHWKFNMAPHGKNFWGSEKRIVALHKDGVDYMKIAKTLNWAAARWPRPYRRFKQDRFPLITGLAMVDQRSWVHMLSVISRGCVWEIDGMSAASIAAEVEGVVGSACQCSDHTPHTASIGLHGCRPRRKPLLKMMHKKARKQFAERQAD